MTPTFLSVVLPPKAEHIVPALTGVFLDSLALAVIDALPEEKLTAFEDVLASGDEQKIVAFIEANVPNARRALAAVADDFRARLAALS